MGKLRNPWWFELQGRYGNMFYVREEVRRVPGVFHVHVLPVVAGALATVLCVCVRLCFLHWGKDERVRCAQCDLQSRVAVAGPLLLPYCLHSLVACRQVLPASKGTCRVQLLPTSIHFLHSSVGIVLSGWRVWLCCP